jgi:hypothetical protein
MCQLLSPVTKTYHLMREKFSQTLRIENKNNLYPRMEEVYV